MRVVCRTVQLRKEAAGAFCMAKGTGLCPRASCQPFTLATGAHRWKEATVTLTARFDREALTMPAQATQVQ